MKQSALYLDIDTLTDMYVGNGVIATLTYTYSVTTYTFEEEDALIIKRSEYTDAIDAYNTAIKNYVGWDAPDPVDALSSEGSYTLGELVKQKYKEYIEVLDARLTQDRHKEIYAKIIALNQEEEPIEQIEGQVTGGSVSLDGSSNVRRSCNLTMVTNNIDINSYYWGIKNKFKLFIGLNNIIDKTYDDII